MSSPLFTILERVDTAADWGAVKFHRFAYVADCCAKVAFRREGESDELQIVLLSEAPRITGQFTQFRLQYFGRAYTPEQALENLLAMVEFDLRDLVRVCEALAFSDRRFGIEVGELCGFSVYKSGLPVSLVCNPFDRIFAKGTTYYCAVRESDTSGAQVR